MNGPADTAASSAPGSFTLGPLAAANGNIRARITDAQFVFDADVTLPIQQGEIDFNQVTVEHVGPDSRMGVSRMGIYVDAPIGRTYLYQFDATPVAGLQFEERAVLNPFAGQRGKLRLQEFAESLLRQTADRWRDWARGFTPQTRQLLGRTTLQGELRLADGWFSLPGMRGELVGRAEGSNALVLRSGSVGGGLTIEIAKLSARGLVVEQAGAKLECAEAQGALVLRVFLHGSGMRFELDASRLLLSGIRARTLQNG